ncbi:NADH-flavin reductase [Alkalilimnicola ehrlichii]|uniref:NADH-flavin reductase n=1 Tax=Alkalilimnicola ehrlichii TaxID=351052 RepID=A0A3E0X2U0_9GAMM|nr:NAD(P)H-binding protein [Alkalilimnicola ehrlichii]RFA30962.1 NADH-flavin reductase [Alkalilimnicola ehrlichii]RFA38913.1 NADH-flavin reductase [Alkalilimnicola ehrlichii]
MNIVIYGAVGDVGKRLVSEALARGHNVTGVVRAEAQLDKLPAKVRGVVADVSDPQQVARTAKEQHVLISAIRPPEGQEEHLVALTRAILDGAEAGQRVLFVGGAARLLIPARSGETVLTAPDFLPASAVAIAHACQAQYELCRTESRVAWTYLSPPAMLTPGQRTGGYRLGTDTLLVDENGMSRISMEDYAVAMLDEAENAKHERRAFTVGY